jgi:hypothetical protein
VELAGAKLVESEMLDPIHIVAYLSGLFVDAPSPLPTSCAESGIKSTRIVLFASQEEVDVGLWHPRRKSWGVLRAKIDEEMVEGKLLLKASRKVLIETNFGTTMRVCPAPRTRRNFPGCANGLGAEDG